MSQNHSAPALSTRVSKSFTSVYSERPRRSILLTIQNLYDAVCCYKAVNVISLPTSASISFDIGFTMHFAVIAFLSLSLGAHSSAAIRLRDGAHSEIRLCNRTDQLQRHGRHGRPHQTLEKHLLSRLAPLLQRLDSLQLVKSMKTPYPEIYWASRRVVAWLPLHRCLNVYTR